MSQFWVWLVRNPGPLWHYSQLRAVSPVTSHSCHFYHCEWLSCQFSKPDRAETLLAKILPCIVSSQMNKWLGSVKENLRQKSEWEVCCKLGGLPTLLGMSFLALPFCSVLIPGTYACRNHLWWYNVQQYQCHVCQHVKLLRFNAWRYLPQYLGRNQENAFSCFCLQDCLSLRAKKTFLMEVYIFSLYPCKISCLYFY